QLDALPHEIHRRSLLGPDAVARQFQEHVFEARLLHLHRSDAAWEIRHQPRDELRAGRDLEMEFAARLLDVDLIFGREIRRELIVAADDDLVAADRALERG